ncbi:MAG: hypothetical protein EXR93_10115 [Gemmatimonadetes bacterium]|nr:hypothetical protein [Gemmatimonadota bacterium]
MKPCSFLAILSLGFSPATYAQAQTARAPLAGTWKAETPDGPRTVVIRADSSASYGDETVRWRMAGDSLHIAFGDEWMVYGYALKGTRLTLSGGDLDEPITLRRAGPPSPRPDSIPLPPAPPADKHGNGSVVPATGAPPGRSGR